MNWPVGFNATISGGLPGALERFQWWYQDQSMLTLTVYTIVALWLSFWFYKMFHTDGTVCA